MTDANHNTHGIANMEQNISHASNAAKEAQGYDPPCRIHIHSVRNRLADSDGVSGKAAIDGLVHAGILIDDSPAHVKEVSYSQEQTKGAEHTTITLTRYRECNQPEHTGNNAR